MTRTPSAGTSGSSEFAQEPDDLQRFGRLLDEKLHGNQLRLRGQSLAQHHLQPLEVVEGPPHLSTMDEGDGKDGGQHKVPRFEQLAQEYDELLEMNARHRSCYDQQRTGPPRVQ
jgi:hypothetical protein